MADPKWLELARKEIGTRELPGPGTNPIVAQYYAEAAGHKQPDSVPWCAAFVGSQVRRAGFVPWGNLMARGALNWPGASKLGRPIPGAIIVFPRGRPPSGHVAIVERVGPGWVDVIGGNQNDMVSRKRYATGPGKVLGYRWPPGAPLPVSLKSMKGLSPEGVTDMNAKEIMEKAKALHSGVDGLMSIKAGRQMAKDTLGLLFYLAKLQAAEPLPKSLKLPKPKVKVVVLRRKPKASK